MGVQFARDPQWGKNNVVGHMPALKMSIVWDSIYFIFHYYRTLKCDKYLLYIQIP